MDAGRMLLQQESSQDTAPFFGFIGAAAALVFSCELGFDACLSQLGGLRTVFKKYCAFQ
jgi:hypothetical protein